MNILTFRKPGTNIDPNIGNEISYVALPKTGGHGNFRIAIIRAWMGALWQTDRNAAISPE